MTVELAISKTGEGDPLVIIHGLFGSKRNWWSIAGQFADTRRGVVADLHNHGASPWDPVHDYPALAADVERLVVVDIAPGRSPATPPTLRSARFSRPTWSVARRALPGT